MMRENKLLFLYDDRVLDKNKDSKNLNNFCVSYSLHKRPNLGI